MLFDERVCNRCKGSGCYSSNPFHVGTCFLCNGEGKCLTAKGKRQKAAYESRLSRNAMDLWVGDHIMSGGSWKKIDSIKYAENASCEVIGKNRDGSPVYSTMLIIEYGGTVAVLSPREIVLSYRYEHDLKTAMKEIEK